MAGHGWTCLDMSGHVWTWLDMVGHGCLDMSGHVWTWLDMAGHGHNTSTLLSTLSGVGVNLQHQHLVRVKSTPVLILKPGSSMDSQLEPGKVDARRKVRFALLVSGFSDLNKMDTAILVHFFGMMHSMINRTP